MKSPSSTGRNPRRLVERSPIPAASSTPDVAEPGVEAEGAFGDFARRTRPPPLARRRNIHGDGGFRPRLTIHQSPCIVSRLSERRKSPRRGISRHPLPKRLPSGGEIPKRLVERSPIPAASPTQGRGAEPGVEADGAFGDFARRTLPPPLARRRNIPGDGGFHPRLPALGYRFGLTTFDSGRRVSVR